ncbi:MAG: hypothetical protein KBT27_02655 [Prevotellaceae bacterium]|nr:hypothetical protein [Candidatus Faecinaster equi]
MTISKDGKNYSIPSSCKTTEDDFITISMGYKAKEIFNKSEIATLIVILTNILYGKNKYEQIRAEAIDKCKEILLSAMAKDGKTKCHEYMVAVNEMEQLKENKC